MALFVGAVLYKVLIKIFNFIVCKLNGMKALNNIDEFFLSDDKKVIIGCYLRADKFDFDKMSNLMKERFPGSIAPARDRLLRMFG